VTDTSDQSRRPHPDEIGLAHVAEILGLHRWTVVRTLDPVLCPRVITLASGRERRFYRRDLVDRYRRGTEMIAAARVNLEREMERARTGRVATIQDFITWSTK
jgi:hypothetical protein